MSDSPRSARAAAIFLEMVDQAPAARRARLRELHEAEPALGVELDTLLARFDEGQVEPVFVLSGGEGPPEHASDHAGERLGSWLLLSELGRGGMGSVWRARRIEGGYEQQVAIKRLHPGIASGSSAKAVIARFHRERQILAGLRHPNIATLLDGGVDADGLPWFAMELVEGLPITAYAQRANLGVAGRLRLLGQALEAVQFAHQRLVVHRDLKPQNLLVTAGGEAKLLDFGIVKLLDEAGGDMQTQTGAALFTPHYAAPEQVEGGEISVATDVYALGVVLYELLVGRRPFADTGGALQLPQLGVDWRVEAPSKALSRQPQRARQARALRGDLDTIVLRCLAREPQRRYPTVRALADDLARHLDGRPILARPDSAGYRLAKFLRRHPLGVSAAALGTLLLLGLTAFSVLQAQRAREAAALADRERDGALAETRRQELLREHYAGVLNRALGSGSAIEPAVLLDLLGEVDASVAASDPGARRTIQLGMADLFVVRNDFARAIVLLEALAPERALLRPAEQVAFAESLATSYLRTGAVERVEAVLDDGDRAAAGAGELQAEGEAALKILRAQWLRSQGRLDDAHAVAMQAVDQADRAPTLGALNHGQLLGNAAQTAMMAGRFDVADALAERALARWSDAGLTRTINFRTLKTLRANLTLLRGRPRQALALFEQIAADPLPTVENAPAAAARESSQARALSLLARHDEAIALAQAAAARFCAALGPATPDCLRIRLVVVDAAVAAGRIAQARDVLARVTALAGPAPALPLVPLLPLYAALLDLAQSPDARTVAAADAALAALSVQGASPARAALRLRLAATDRLLVAGADALARALMQPALVVGAPGVSSPDQGLDPALLALWRATAGDSASVESDAALRALAEHLGPEHPGVALWRARVVVPR